MDRSGREDWTQPSLGPFCSVLSPTGEHRQFLDAVSCGPLNFAEESTCLLSFSTEGLRVRCPKGLAAPSTLPAQKSVRRKQGV